MKKRLLYMVTALVLLFSMMPVFTVQAAADWYSAPEIPDAVGDASDAPDIVGVAFDTDDTNVYIKIRSADTIPASGIVWQTFIDIDSSLGTGDPSTDPSALTGGDLLIDVDLGFGMVMASRWLGSYQLIANGSAQLVDAGLAIEVTIPKAILYPAEITELEDGFYLKEVVINNNIAFPGPVDYAEGPFPALDGGGGGGGGAIYVEPTWPQIPSISDPEDANGLVPDIIRVDYAANATNAALRFVANTTFTFTSLGVTVALDIDDNTGTGASANAFGQDSPAGIEYVIRTSYMSGQYMGTELFRYDAPSTPVNADGMIFGDSSTALGYFYWDFPLTVFGSDAAQVGDGTIAVDAVVAGPGETEPIIIDQIIGVTGEGGETYQPSAVPSPNSGPAGTVTTVTGFNWAPSDSITSVTVGGATADNDLAVDGGGQLSGTVTIPSLSDGQQDLVITGTQTGEQTFTGAFTVTSVPQGPTAQFNPTSGPVGTVVAVTGSGWNDYANITSVTVGGETAIHTLAGGNIGELTGTITIPQLNPGTYDIVINGQVDGQQTFADAFTVTAPPVQNIIRNGDFSNGFAEWQVHPSLPQDWMPVNEGRADVSPPDYNYLGAVYYQNVDVTDVASTTFTMALDISNPDGGNAGNTVAIYIVYVDTSDQIQKIEVLNPANADLSDATPVNANFTLPSDARKVVKVAVVKKEQGDFTIDNLVLTADGVTINDVPIITGISSNQGAYGTPLTITGTGFGSTEGEVTIGGAPFGISVSSWSDTSITVDVVEPARGGPVVVTADFVDSNIGPFYEITSPYFTLDAKTDYVQVLKGTNAVGVLGLKFFNGFAPQNGITLQFAQESDVSSGIFAPAIHYVPGGAVAKIDTSGINEGVYQVVVEAVGNDFVTRTTVFTLEVSVTTDITFSQSLSTVTSVTADKQGSLSVYASGTDSLGNDITPLLDITSDNPSVADIFEYNYSYNVFALTSGTANLIATAPDGYSESIPVTVTVPADPAILNISLTPAVTTNLWDDTMTFYAQGSRAIDSSSIYGMTTDEMIEDTRQAYNLNTEYGGTFKLNPDNPPGLGTFLFGVGIGDTQSVAPLTVVNDESYSALSVGVIPLDDAVDPFTLGQYTIEFYQNDIFQFSREVFQHPGMGAPEYYMPAIPPGTYTLRYVPGNTGVLSQWWANEGDPQYATDVEFAAGQVTENIYFFVMGYPQGEEADLVSVEVLPANPSRNVGDTLQFSATAHYANGYTDEWAGYSATWDSSDDTVASIDGSGNVEALANGVTTISATVSGVTGSTVLTVGTPPALSVATLAASGVTTGEATLNGNLISLDGDSVDVSFEWGTTSGQYTEETTAEAMTGAGSFTADLPVLTDNTTYYFRAKAVGDTTEYGSEMSFKTLEIVPPPPLVVTTVGPAIMTVNSARLNGLLVSLDGPSANVSFVFGTSPDSYTNQTATLEINVPNTPFFIDVNGLADNTTYYFRAKAVGGTTVYGDEMSFKTLEIIPPAVLAVNTVGSANLTENSVRLQGLLVSLDGDSANVSFEFGTSSGSYTNQTALLQINLPNTPFFIDVNGLADNTTYYFRAKAVGDTTVYGSEMSFKTLEIVPPAVPGDANGDGSVNVLDITKMIKIILEYDDPTPGADFNGDQVVNVLDITKVVRVILHID